MHLLKEKKRNSISRRYFRIHAVQYKQKKIEDALHVKEKIERKPTPMTLLMDDNFTREEAHFAKRGSIVFQYKPSVDAKLRLQIIILRRQQVGAKRHQRYYVLKLATSRSAELQQEMLQHVCLHSCTLN